MSETPFHQTRMGHTFFETTVPSLVRELQRLNDNIERILAVAERGDKVPAPGAPRGGETQEHP